MKFLLRKCVDCGEYTFKEICPYCGGNVRVPQPSRFSIEDRVGKWRRQQKREFYKKVSDSEIEGEDI